MYSGEYDACDVTLSVYPHRTSLKNMPDHGGNRTYDLWNTSPMLCQLSYAVWSVRVCDISEQNLVPLISKELDSVPKYHILEPTRPRSSVGRALGWYSKGRRFDSHRGQAYFSSLPGVDIHSE